jgi:hypothetical protein
MYLLGTVLINYYNLFIYYLNVFKIIGIFNIWFNHLDHPT